MLRLPLSHVRAGRYRTRTATTTTAASGRNREELLGPRSDFSRPRQGVAEKSANATRKAISARCAVPGLIRMSTKVVRTRFFMKKDSGTFFVYRRFCGACTHVRRKMAKFHYIGGVLSWGECGILGLVQQIGICDGR